MDIHVLQTLQTLCKTNNSFIKKAQERDFKQLAHAIMGAERSEVSRVGQ